MRSFSWPAASVAVVAALFSAGCAVVPSADWNALKTENGTLQAENRAQTARLQNLEAHSRSLESKLRDTEEQLAILDEQHELNRRKVASYEFDRNQLSTQLQNVAGRWPVSPALSRQLAEIARRYPQLHFDPQTGIAKLDTDILFDVGRSDIKPAAEETLRELVSLLKSPDAQDFRVMVVGHTDDRPVAKKPARDNFRDNFDLSADRAVAVSEALERLGLQEGRMGVAGFGAHQPVAPNITSTDRQKNRRVELFVLPPDVPVIGWTETIPSVY